MLKNLLISLMVAGLTLNPLGFALADVKPQGGTVGTHSNGTEVVEIAKPNDNKVSYNAYDKFDVGAPGVILNNSTGYANTILGDHHIDPNSKFEGTAANVILNEVLNPKASSQIKGMVEVGGQKAHVIIANPKGLNIDGGGFINATSGTFVAGSINNPNSIVAYEDAQYGITNGPITVGTGGLTHEDANSTTNLLAKAVTIQGEVKGKTVNVIAGVNGSTTGRAIDVKNLGGGIYADSISLVSTDKGAGVFNGGNIVAGQSLTVSSEGVLENTFHISTMKSGGDINLTSTGNTSNYGLIEAKKNLNITSDQLENKIAKYNNGVVGTLKSTEGNINLANKGMVNYGDIAANQDLVVDSTGNLRNYAGASMKSTSGNIKLNSTGTASSLENSGLIEAKNDLTVNGAGKLTNNTGASLKSLDGAMNLAGGTVYNYGDIEAKQDLTVASLGTVYNGKGANLKSTAGSMDLASGNKAQLYNSGAIDAAKDITMNAAGSLDNYGTIVAKGDADLSGATKFTNYNSINVGGSLLMEGGTVGSSNNSDGWNNGAPAGAAATITAGGDITINALSGQAKAYQGNIESTAGAVNINAAKGIYISGNLTSAKDMTLKNAAGTLQTLFSRIGTDWDTTDYGVIKSGGTLTMETAGNNSSILNMGEIYAKDDIVMTATGTGNQIKNAPYLKVSDGKGGYIQKGGVIASENGSITVTSNGGRVENGSLGFEQAIMTAKGPITINATNSPNSYYGYIINHGYMGSDDNINWNYDTTAVNWDKGVVRTAKDFTSIGATSQTAGGSSYGFDNIGWIEADGNVSIKTGAGFRNAFHKQYVHPNSIYVGPEATILARGDINIDAGKYSINEGHIDAAGTTDADGNLLSGGNLNIEVDGAGYGMINYNRIESRGDANIDIKGYLYNYGNVISSGGLDIAVSTNFFNYDPKGQYPFPDYTDYGKNRIESAENMHINAGGQFWNDGWIISSGEGYFTAGTKNFYNNNTIEASKRLVAMSDAGKFFNDGRIIGSDEVIVSGYSVFNDGQSDEAYRNNRLAAEMSGIIEARGDLLVQATGIIDPDSTVIKNYGHARMIASGSASLLSAGHVWNDGRVESGKNMQVYANGGDLTNHGYLISSENNSLSASGNFLNTNRIESTNDTTATIGGGSTNMGFMVSSGHLSVYTGGDFLNAKSMEATKNLYVYTTMGDWLNQAEATMIASGQLMGQSAGTLVNDGDLESSEDMVLTAEGQLDINGRAISSANNTIRSRNASANVNQTGVVESTGDMAISAGTDVNVAGRAISSGNNTMTAGNNVNITGVAESTNNMAMTADADVNVAGRAISSGNNTVTAGKAVSITGVVEAGNDMALTAGDNVELYGRAIASGNNTVNSGKTFYVANKGEDAIGVIEAGKDMSVNAGNNVEIYGRAIASGNNTMVADGKFNVYETGVIESGQNMALTANDKQEVTDDPVSMNLQGRAISSGDLSMTANDLRISSTGVAEAGKDMTLTSRATGISESLKVNGRAIASGKNTVDAAGNLIIGTTGVVESGDDMALNSTTGNIDVYGRAISSGKNTLTANQGVYIANKGEDAIGVIESGKDMSVTAGSDINIYGRAISSGANTITAGGNLSVKEIGVVESTNDMALSSDKSIVIAGRAISSGANTMNADGAIRITDTGVAESGDDMALTANKNIDIAGRAISSGNNTMTALDAIRIATTGVVEATKDMALTSKNNNVNINGRAIASGSNTVKAGDSIHIEATGVAEAGTDMALTAPNNVHVWGRAIASGNNTMNGGQEVYITESGVAEAGKDMALTSGTNNVTVAGRAIASGNNTLTAGQTVFVTETGTVEAGKDMALTADKSINVSGRAAAAGDATVKAKDTVQVTGTGYLEAYGNMILEGASIGNAGEIFGLGNVTATTPGDMKNSGRLYAKDTLNINANNVSNSDRIFVDGNANINAAGNFDNSGFVKVNGLNAVINAAGNWNNLAGGDIVALGDLNVSGAAVNNAKDASIWAEGNLNAKANSGDFTNSGYAGARKSIEMTSAKKFTNNDLVATDGYIKINAQGDLLNADSAQISSGNTLTINVADGILTNNGHLFAPKTVNISANGANGAFTNNGSILGLENVDLNGQKSFTIGKASSLHANGTINITDPNNTFTYTEAVYGQNISGKSLVDNGAKVW